MVKASYSSVPKPAAVAADPKPTALKVVAWLYIIGGIFAVIHIHVDLVNGRFTLDSSVLGLFVGRGLLRLSRGWLTIAYVVAWISLITVAGIAAFCVVAAVVGFDFNPRINLQSTRFALSSPIWGTLACIPVFLLFLWEVRVLMRPDVRRLFGVIA